MTLEEELKKVLDKWIGKARWMDGYEIVMEHKEITFYAGYRNRSGDVPFDLIVELAEIIKEKGGVKND